MTLYKTSKSSKTVALKLRNEEFDQLDQLAKDSDTNRSAIMREAYLLLKDNPKFLAHMKAITMKNGRTR